jgi:type 1 glutamine amidotransferase
VILFAMILGATAPNVAPQQERADEIPYTRLETRRATRAAVLRALSPAPVEWGEWFLCGPFPYAGHGRDDLRTPRGPEVELAKMRAGVALDLDAVYTGKKGVDAPWAPLGRVAGKRIDLHRGDDPELQNNVTGYLHTTIEASAARQLECTLGSDDGIRLWLNGELLLDKDVPRGLNALDDRLVFDLAEGINDVLIKVVDGSGGWEFQILTDESLEERLEAQLEYLLDRDFPPTRAHEYYRVMTVPIPEELVVEVGGLDVLPDGRPALSTRRGDVFLVEGAYAEPPLDTRFELYAEGLHEPLGLESRDEEGDLALYVVQRGELTRLTDQDGDGRADMYETICDDWGVSGNYHEFAFGPRFDDEGNAWITLNVGFCGSLGKSTVPWRGWAVKVTPKGELLPVCDGLRSPNGLGAWKDGEMFYVDNQGDYVATNRLSHLKQDAYQGHPAGLRWREGVDSVEDSAPERQPAAVWFPYRKMGQSAADVVLDSTNGGFGPFSEQFFVGDQMMASVMRVDLEQVNGHYQGACYPFIDGLDSGVNRIAFAPDGSMFVGQTDRGWGSIGDRTYGLQRIVWTGEVPFEILHMAARPNGFELHFTGDLDTEAAADPDAYSMVSYTYEYHPEYGAPEDDKQEAKITRAEITGPRSVRLHLEEMRAGYVHELRAAGVRDAANKPLVHEMAYYSLMEVPGSGSTRESVTQETPASAEKATERLLYLTHSAGFEHGVIKRRQEGRLAVAEKRMIEAAGDDYEVTVTKDCATINPENLAKYDAVVFYTTGELPISKENLDAFIDWVANGGAFVGIHCATDTLYEYKPYMDMIGGGFDGHPWHEDVKLVIEDRNHPSTEHLGETWPVWDEIYQFKWFRRFPLHGLMHLSGEVADLAKGKRADGDYVNAWCKPFGEGRVFYTALGHRAEMWARKDFQQHLMGGIRWAIHGPDGPTPAPEGAKLLMEPGNTSAWAHADGRDCEWLESDGVFTVRPGTGDVFTREHFSDGLIHLEFSPSEHPDQVKGQGRGNSGVYLMGQYELQVLDSYGLEPKMGDCGACYGVALPDVAPYRPAGQWSSYDIEFTAPRFDTEGKKTASARITAWLNGRKIHDDIEVPGPTAASWRSDEFPLGPIKLQDHGNPVRFRNAWFLPR